MKKSYLLFGLLFLSSFLGCERDDICSQDKITTPRLIIEFYDNINRDNPKNVANLRVQGVGNDQPLPNYNPQNPNSYDGSDNLQIIYLPLKTNFAEGEMGTTQYILTKDYEEDENGNGSGNEVTLIVNYFTNQVYVSRACGYKTVFENPSISTEPETNVWILGYEQINENQIVENENETHFKIYH